MEAVRPNEAPGAPIPSSGEAPASHSADATRSDPARAIAARPEQTQFLLEASRLLMESLEYELTLSRLARLAVPAVADLCVIELAGDDGTRTAVEVAHDDAAVRVRLFALYRSSSSAGDATGSARVLSNGTPELWEAGGDRSSELGRALSELGVHSLMILPMKARGRMLGVLTLGGGPSRGFDAGDLRMAEDLAERTAMAVANAREFLEAKNAVRTREDLLGIVSHDLRNPLNVTLMKCAMMMRDSSGNAGNERLKRDVETIERATRRMDRLLKDLQDFSTIQTGHLAIERRSESALELANEVAESARAMAGKRKVDIEIRDIPDDLRVPCDRERVLQVCSNLVGNALKFTPEGGAVTVSVRLEGDGLSFSVKDTGIGIDADELPHVFQKYWRARKTSRGGVGLGLFIARALVLEHGGRIWAESAKGAGSTFTFSLPMGQASADVDARRVLIVDDDVDLRRELGEVLTTEGRPVAFAADGRQALSYLKNNAPPALILLDLMMPVMDGWEFCATVRADAELSRIPIIVLSCLERHESNVSMAGVAGYLRKPIQLEKLLGAVSSAASAPAGPRATAAASAE